jgi:hypothetical protein
VGEAAWHHSVTQDISCSGVFFRADSDVNPDVMVEIELRRPSVARLNPAGACVVALARIVRRAESAVLGDPPHPVHAAAFLDCSFSRLARCPPTKVPYKTPPIGGGSTTFPRLSAPAVHLTFA